MRFTLAFAALAATTAFAAPATAQSTGVSSDSIEARALLIQPATLQRVQDLSFGTIIATPADSGTVTIDPNTGVRTVALPLTGSTTDVGQRGRFIGNGTTNQTVLITRTFPTFLANSADLTKTVAFSGTLDSASTSGTVNTGATSVFYVGVGGTITISANQMPGLYTGQVTVTADFQ